MSFESCKFLVVGAGFWGAVMAERLASVLDEPVLVIDKRPHIGGNSHSAPDPETGIECHSYGTHIFHTRLPRVWEYIRRFSEFTGYRHRVLTTYRDRVYPMPISLATIKGDPRFQDMALIKYSRLSVQPVTDEEWALLCAMGGV